MEADWEKEWIPPEEMSIEQLHAEIKQLETRNAAFRRENMVFETFLKRVSAPLHPFASASTSLQPLTSEQRFFVVETVLRDTREEIEHTKESSEAFLEQLRVNDHQFKS